MNYTRGSGIMENFLSRQRAAVANKLIPDSLRSGAILDIGCGSYPFFLINTEFREKHGIDPEAEIPAEGKDITLHHFLIYPDSRLPFADVTFGAVTSLGTLEHFDESTFFTICRETYRVLIPGGVLVMTSPAPWTMRILSAVSQWNIISPSEIRDARHVRDTDKFVAAFKAVGFHGANISTGFFQSGMNRWFRVQR